MNSIKLSNRYRLYAFPDYGSMRAALPYLQRVVLAKNLTEVEEQEVRGLVQRSSHNGYKNYLEPLGLQTTYTSAARSFITALQALYKSNGYAARYVVVERC